LLLAPWLARGAADAHGGTDLFVAGRAAAAAAAAAEATAAKAAIKRQTGAMLVERANCLLRQGDSKDVQ
jgi:hypothetical protein